MYGFVYSIRDEVTHYIRKAACNREVSDGF